MIVENLKKLYNKIVILIVLIILIVIFFLLIIVYFYELYYINGQKYFVWWYWKIIEGGVIKFYIKINSDYLKLLFVEVYNNVLNNWNNVWSLNLLFSFVRFLNLKIYIYLYVKFENILFNLVELFFVILIKEWWKVIVGENGNIVGFVFIINIDGI